MHELSIAIQILNSVQQYANEKNYNEISKIHLKIGKFQAIVPESLEFMFNNVKEKYPSAVNSELIMDFIDIKAKCDICNEIFTIKYINLICPNNNHHSLRIIEGNELLIESIEI